MRTAKPTLKVFELKRVMLMEKKVKTLFIVSSGRTGTQFMSRFFADNFEKIKSVHEPKPDLFAIGTKKFIENRSKSSILTSIKNARLAHLESAVEHGCDFYIESNPNLTYVLDEVQELYPNSKFVFISRNPTDTVRSMYSKSPDSSGVMLFYGSNDHRRRLRSSDLPNDKWNLHWHSFSRFQRICWHWQFANGKALDFCRRNENCLQVKFEDIFLSDNAEVLNQIIRFLGIKDLQKRPLSPELIHKKLNTNPKQLLPSRESWSENELLQFAELTSKVSLELGY